MKGREVHSFVVCFLIFFLNCTAWGDALDTWTPVSVSPYGAFTNIINANGTWVALSTQPPGPSSVVSGVSYSSDGINWTNLQAGDVPSGLVFANGVFVKSSWDAGTGGDAGFFKTSTNPADLAASGTPQDLLIGLHGVDFGNGVFVTVGNSPIGGDSVIYSSPDGTNWTARSTLTNILYTGVAYGNAGFIAVGFTNLFTGTITPYVIGSTNGTNWSRISATFNSSPNPLPPHPTLQGVNFIHGLYYATMRGSDGTIVNFGSTQGTLWGVENPPLPTLFVPGLSNGGTYISVNNGSNLYTSINAANWTLQKTGLTNTLDCIAFDGQHFVIGCADGTLLRSGSVVPSLSGSMTNGGFQLMVNGGFGGYALQASPDLVNWSNVTTFTNIESSNQFLDLGTTNFQKRFYRVVGQ